MPRNSDPPLSRASAAAAALAVAALLAPGAAQAAPAKAGGGATPSPLTASTKTLKAEVGKLPHKTRAQGKLRSRLTVRAAAVASQAKRGHLCSAKTASKGLRLQVKTTKSFTAKQRAAVTGAALQVETRLLSLPGAARCGGVTTAPAPGAAPVTSVLSSTPQELNVSVALPAVQLEAKTGGGKTFTEATMPGVSNAGATGGPSVPSIGQAFAIPAGATVSVSGQESSSYTLEGVDLYPTQKSAVDAPGAPVSPQDKAFADKPFTQDAKAYSSGRPFPAVPATAAALPQGDLRDLQLGQLDLAGAQYTPKTKSLKVFTKVTIDVKFNGGAGTFGDDGTNSPYNQSFLKLYGNVLTNGPTVLANLAKYRGVHLICGEEMLVVTSPALKAAADTFATARNAAGILTKVVQTGDPGVGSTADSIRTFVQGEVGKSGCIRPSYLTLMGDTANVPTFHGGDAGQGDIPTDFVYAEKWSGVPLPNLAVGRIPADSLASANTMVGKIVGYETAPPTDAAFYQNATVTSYFQGPGPQDQRGFVRSAEALRTGMMANGKTVQRLMTKDAGANAQKFDDGTNLPAGLSFTATNADVVSAFNAGRFLFVSRDHGYQYGVSAPSWGWADVPNLSNGNQLPMTWLIACSTGRFDSPGDASLAERLLAKSGGGSVGVVAASRDSPSEVNNRLLLGLGDAVWPNILPYDGASTPIRRGGDILNAGKLHVILESASLADFYGGGSPTADIRNEQRLYNYFGDPSMQMRLAKPLFGTFTGVFDAGLVHLAGLTGAAGGAATLLENGVPVGKAFVAGDGSVDIDPNAPVGPGKLEAVVDADGYAPVTITVRDAVTPTPASSPSPSPSPTPGATPTPAPTPVPLPDLVVTSVTSSQPANTTVALPPVVTLTVKNQGTAPAGASLGTVSGTNSQTGGQSTVRMQFPELAPGESSTQTVRGTLLYNTLTGTADVGQDVTESDEGNNTGTGQGPSFKP